MIRSARLLAALATLVAAAPLAYAQVPSGWILGTEDAPELPAGGPVVYGPAYTGPPNQDFLRIQAGWFQYDNQTDRIAWSLKVGDADALTAPQPDWSRECQAAGNVTLREEVRGTLRFLWQRLPNGSVRESVGFEPPPSSAVSNSVAGHGLPHEFVLRPGSPGYFVYRVPRESLVALGDSIDDLRGECAEYYQPAQTTGLTGAYDRASENTSSQAVYSFTDLRRVKGPDGQLDPVERFERENATRSPSGSMVETTHTRTPALGPVALIGTMLAVPLLRRRAHK